jgi:hypothetical protein
MVPLSGGLPGAPNGHVMARRLVSCAALGGVGVAESNTPSVGAPAERCHRRPQGAAESGSYDDELLAELLDATPEGLPRQRRLRQQLS